MPQAFGLGYDEDGPLGLPCTEPRNEALVHGLPVPSGIVGILHSRLMYEGQHKVGGDLPSDSPSAGPLHAQILQKN
jgi:hypothetical protein